MGSVSLIAMPAVASAQWSEGLNKAGSSELPADTLVNIITNLMFWILVIFGAMAIIGFVISGILYLTAAGDETKVDKAKNAMIYSIIGVLVALIGLVIVQAVNNWIGGSSQF